MARVLLIDDDGDQLELRQLILVHHGHDVAAASSADDALRLFGEHAPDCIVMDLRLPRAENGLSLIRSFRESKFAGRIVILSGFPNDLRDTAEESLVDSVLTKPVRSEVLVALIAEA